MFPDNAMLHTDCDSCYTSTAVQRLLAANGLRQRTTSPHSQAQNGTAERRFRTIFDAERALREDMKLPNDLWFLAAKHACFVRNTLPTSTLGASPYEILFKEQFDHSLLHVFGCLAYLHKHNRDSKLSAKATRAVYIGFELRNKTSRFLKLDNGTIVTALHVTVREHISGYTPEKESDDLSTLVTPALHQIVDNDVDARTRAESPPSPAPPATDDDEVVYKIDKIIDSQVNEDGERLFLVRWLEYGPEFDSWEPFAVLNEAQALDVWLAAHPDWAPQWAASALARQRVPRQARLP